MKNEELFQIYYNIETNCDNSIKKCDFTKS